MKNIVIISVILVVIYLVYLYFNKSKETSNQNTNTNSSNTTNYAGTNYSSNNSNSSTNTTTSNTQTQITPSSDGKKYVYVKSTLLVPTTVFTKSDLSSFVKYSPGAFIGEYQKTIISGGRNMYVTTSGRIAYEMFSELKGVQ